jgi:hypothetical protein
MGVHVGELHTDIVSTPGSGVETPAAPPTSPGAAQERWGELRRTAEVLDWRTASEGFDD